MASSVAGHTMMSDSPSRATLSTVPESLAPQQDHTAVSPNDNLSDRLNTEYLDIDPDDRGCLAQLTRCIAESVGFCCTPHRMLVTMRLLKAITFSFLVLTIAADVMYIFFVDFLSEYGDDGWRGMIVRFYGIGLSVMAIMMELDVQKMVHYYLGLKGFIPRSLLLLLIAVITNASPMHHSNRASHGRSRYLASDDDVYFQSNDDNSYAVNDGVSDLSSSGFVDDGYDDNYNGGNTGNGGSGYNGNAGYVNQNNYPSSNYDAQNGAYNHGSSYDSMNDVPVSAIAFQMVTSWVLACCALCYFVLGLFCCDRFTSKAFMSTKDPVASTVIPQSRGSNSPDRSYAISEMSASTPYVQG